MHLPIIVFFELATLFLSSTYQSNYIFCADALQVMNIHTICIDLHFQEQTAPKTISDQLMD